MLYEVITSSFEEQSRQDQEQILQENMTRLFAAQTQSHASESLWQTVRQLPVNRLDQGVSLLVCTSKGMLVLSQARFSNPSLQAASLCLDLVPQLNAMPSAFHLGQTTPQDAPYDFYYSLRVSRNRLEPETFYFLLIKPAQAYQQSIILNRKLSQRRGLALFLIVAIILIISTRWSLSSLKRLQREINAIKESYNFV